MQTYVSICSLTSTTEAHLLRRDSVSELAGQSSCIKDTEMDTPQNNVSAQPQPLPLGSKVRQEHVLAVTRLVSPRAYL